MFNKILIANRGEIAVRISRTARTLGIPTLAIYAEDDQASMHIQLADEAVSLGKGHLSDNYLNIDKIIGIALEHQCDAIHPGYGFLSENPAFVKACEVAKITFIGPNSEAIQLMGNKIAARKFAKEAGVPITEGFSGSVDEILDKAQTLQFPLLIKAASGGGGKGMRIVHEPKELKQAIESTSREAKSYFGDDAVYVEQYLDHPRHIEVQILGDSHGNVLHFYERECSLQRRYQKIIEEAPSPTLDAQTRQSICESAVKLAKAISYTNAGTIEFLLDQNQKFYFLEMNTRIQVEHPVTEMTTKVDLVAQQILIAAGQPIAMSQQDIIQEGHAIECRIYAESPENNFLPSPGKISYYSPPSSRLYRLDTYLDRPATIQSSYDPMIAKLVVYGKDRDQARQASITALKNYAIHGIDTNIHFLLHLLQSQEFQANQISTKYCDQETSRLLTEMKSQKEKIAPLTLMAASLTYEILKDRKDENVWQEIGFWRILPAIQWRFEEKDYRLELWQNTPQKYELIFENTSYTLTLISHDAGKVEFSLEGQNYQAYVSQLEDQSYQLSMEGMQFNLVRADVLNVSDLTIEENMTDDATDRLSSPMPGKVIQLNVKQGDQVKKGDVLLIVEAMKMENNIVSPQDATVTEVYVEMDAMVERNMPLVKLS